MDLVSNPPGMLSKDPSVQVAIRYCKLLGYLPQTFGVTVRSLILDHRNGDGISSGSQFQLKRLLKAPTLLSSLYYATRTYFPEIFADNEKKTPFDLVEPYDPLSLAALLSNMYLYKRCKRFCNKDEWKFISEPLQRNLEIAGKLGVSYSPVGLSVALVSGFIHYAFAIFSAQNMAAFTEYRRYLKKEDIDFDLKYELQHFNCTSVQVACNILLGLGFGIETTDAFQRGMNFTSTRIPKNFKDFPFLVMRMWMSKLQPKIAKGQLPGTEFAALPDDDRNMLIEDIAECYKSGSKFNWIEKGKGDLTQEAMDELDLPDETLGLMEQSDATSDEEGGAESSEE